MIEKLDIEGIHLNIEDNMRRYVKRKIGRLDKYLPKHARKSVRAEVLLKSTSSKKNHSGCEVILHLPKETIRVQESTTNVFAAIDIVEAKLHNRILKYKDLHANPKLSRHLINRIRKKTP